MFYRFIYFLIRIIATPLFRIRVHGIENIPKDEKYIICANHKSFLDPIFVALAINRQVHFIAKKELFEIPILKSILKKLNAIPAQRDGKDLSVLRDSIKLIKKGKILGIFPEGTRVKKVSEENMKTGVAMIASRAGADVIPVFINSNYKFRSKVEVFVRDKIAILSFDDVSKDIRNKAITRAIYENIYKVN